MEVLDNFKSVEVETPVDIIVRQIRSLIVSGTLKPGEKLPSERKLAERMGVGRTYVRDAIKKLEFYGILQTIPQSGVMINGVDLTAMEGLLSNVMKIEEPDFFSLVETRVIMESFSARSAAERRTEEDLEKLRMALENYEAKLASGEPSENEDFIFHLRIAEASHNPVMKSMMLIILPDILNIYISRKICSEALSETKKVELGEHRMILKAIEDQDSELAERSMQAHLQKVIEFSQTKQ